MTGQFLQGLVVGKFSPLHRGHELLIGCAQEQCQRLAIISYAKPEFAGCGADRREEWLGSLFPHIQRLVVTDERLKEWFPAGDVSLPPDEADESIHRLFVGRLCRDVLAISVDAVFTSEDYGDGFAEELTSFFRSYDPTLPTVRHILVDRQRTRIPVSGSMLRSGLHEQRQWLAPVVYASFVQRVCVLGGESSGKSTLTAALAEYFDTDYVEEYGRELWDKKYGQLEYEDMLAIAQEQVVREERSLLSARRYLFCDTSPLTTLFYSRFLFGRSDPALEVLACRCYGLVVLCEPDIMFIQDGTRQAPGFREKQHEWYLEELERRKIPYVRVNGSVLERVGKTVAALDRNDCF